MLAAEDLTVIVPEIAEPGWTDPLPLAINDSAFFHAILLRSAVHSNVLTGHARKLEDVFHRIRLIQLVNERLKMPVEKLSSSTIIAIAFLALAEGSVPF
jgi:hypothetical protein